jgi:hypothetical protein
MIDLVKFRSAFLPGDAIRRAGRVTAVAVCLLIISAPSVRATLIVTAICKDGVVVRSDKRNAIKRRGKPVEYQDVLNKVFANEDKSIIIYNHGINRINRVPWIEHATTLAAKLQEAKVADIGAAMNLVEATLADAMAAEFARNKHDDFSAFVVVMKMADDRYRAGEISWKKGRPVGKKALGRIILSGSGKKYCHRTDEQKGNGHWAKMSVEQARAEIGALFDEASKRQAEAKGHEFSEQSDEMMVEW